MTPAKARQRLIDLTRALPCEACGFAEGGATVFAPIDLDAERVPDPDPVACPTCGYSPPKFYPVTFDGDATVSE